MPTYTYRAVTSSGVVVRKTGGKPSNRREEIREQKARGERNKRKRKGYKHSK